MGWQFTSRVGKTLCSWGQNQKKFDPLISWPQNACSDSALINPICVMYGIFTRIWFILSVSMLVNIPAPWSIGASAKKVANAFWSFWTQTSAFCWATWICIPVGTVRGLLPKYNPCVACIVIVKWGLHSYLENYTGAPLFLFVASFANNIYIYVYTYSYIMLYSYIYVYI